MKNSTRVHLRKGQQLLTRLLPFALLPFALSLFGCAELSELHEDELASSEKIIGGYDDQAPPYMASLFFENHHTCGGSLVRGDWVLTAAHCVDVFPIQAYSVCVGRTKLSECSRAANAKIVEVHIHKNWDRERYRQGYDIALLKLDRSFPNPVELADADFEPPTGAMVNLRGWGVSSYDGGIGTGPDHMQRLKLPYRSARDCYKDAVYEGGERLSPEEIVICTEPRGDRAAIEAEASPCNGDSGGPVHYRGRQIGLVSFGSHSEAQRCDAGALSGHTRIAAYRAWIDRKIAEREQRLDQLSPRQRAFAAGALINLQSSNGQYVAAEGGGGGALHANRDSGSLWETFEVVERGGDRVALRSSRGDFLCAEGGGGGALNADRGEIGAWETFTVVEAGEGRFAFQTINGHFLVAEGGGGGILRADRQAIGDWERFKVHQR